MKFVLTILVTIIICYTSPFTAATVSPPEQVHVSLGLSEGDYMVSWVTQAPTRNTSIKYGHNEHQLTNFLNGEQEEFIDGGKKKRRIYMHRVKLSDLSERKTIFYQVGSDSDDQGWSKVLQFRTVPRGANWSPQIVVYGDLGVDNARAVPSLINETTAGHFDLVLHVGDLAYDMNEQEGQVGDAFMRMIEPIASQIPYMTCPGNHENAYNFSHYRRRFSMPGGDGEGQFFSFNVGPAHIVAYSTEFYYYLNYGWKQIENQYRWLEQDLKIANLPENRKQRPWIIVMGHRPMYCSNLRNFEHCFNNHNYARVGIPFSHVFHRAYLFGLEELFYRHGVDLMFWAHEHSYERMWPVYNMTVCNGTVDPHNPYNNPPAPVHIVTGSAGNREGEDPFLPGGRPWSAFRLDDYGYTRMKIWNATHLSLEQFSVDKPQGIMDVMMYIRDSHGPQVFSCHSKKEVPQY